MRIHELLFWHDELSGANQSGSQLNFPPARSNDFLANLARAFTRHGEVKRPWNPNELEGQTSAPAPPDAGTELIPSGTLEPPTASRQAEPVVTEPSVGQHSARAGRYWQIR